MCSYFKSIGEMTEVTLRGDDDPFNESYVAWLLFGSCVVLAVGQMSCINFAMAQFDGKDSMYFNGRALVELLLTLRFPLLLTSCRSVVLAAV